MDQEKKYRELFESIGLDEAQRKKLAELAIADDLSKTANQQTIFISAEADTEVLEEREK